MKDKTYRAFVEGIPARGPRCTEIEEPWDQQLRPPKKQPVKRTRKRKVTVERAMKQANKAGLAVSSATITAEGGVKLELGEKSNVGPNEWDEVQ